MGIGLEKTTPTKEPQRHVIARWVSAIIHPIAFPLLTLGVVTYTATTSFTEASRWLVLAIVLTSLPVAVLVGLQVLRGRWTDFDVSVRRQRYALYPFGLACMLALILAYAHFGAPRVAIRTMGAFAIANTIDAVINFVYKVSAHATGAAACATLLWLGSTPAWGIAATGAALLVGWSRVELGRHTRGQVMLGWGVGVISSVAAFALR
ncbi:MAG TPA: phosphatase PAP2 family protein [Ktedonobacterales bacterium]|nr:phosphatase PAP2 family protein [Ktedonobacterales bacterium]